MSGSLYRHFDGFPPETIPPDGLDPVTFTTVGCSEFDPARVFLQQDDECVACRRSTLISFSGIGEVKMSPSLLPMAGVPPTDRPDLPHHYHHLAGGSPTKPQHLVGQDPSAFSWAWLDTLTNVSVPGSPLNSDAESLRHFLSVAGDQRHGRPNR